jgi:hypothetical protein
MIDDKLIAKVQRAAQYREVDSAIFERIKIFERINLITENDPSCIYIAYCKETNLYKIGTSTRPQERLKELNATSAYKIELFRIFIVYAPFARPFEKLLHKIFSHCRTHQEWFKLGEIELMWLKSNSCLFSVNLTTHTPLVEHYSPFPDSWRVMI